VYYVTASNKFWVIASNLYKMIFYVITFIIRNHITCTIMVHAFLYKFEHKSNGYRFEAAQVQSWNFSSTFQTYFVKFI